MYICFVLGLSGKIVNAALSQWCNSFPGNATNWKNINFLEQLKENGEVNLGTLGS